MKRMIGTGIAVGIALSLAACGGASSASKTEETTASVETKVEETEADTTEEAKDEVKAEEAESPYYFKDMEIVTQDYTMKITDWKVIPVGEEGNSYGKTPVIAFWYDTTNTSGKEIDPSSAWISIMQAVQDNDPNAINELNIAALPDSSYLDSQMAKIKEGGTVSNAVAYELSDTETPVELTASNGLLGDDIGAMTFDIVSGNTENGAEASIGTVENTAKAEPSFSDNVIVTDDYTIEILDYKVIPVGEEGNKYGKAPVIAFWYNTTNTSGKEIDPNSAWIFIMEAVQDNDPNMVNKLNVASLPDSRFLDSQMAKIKAGGTVENAVAYELTDTETPVELTAKPNMFGDPLGTETFEVK